MPRVELEADADAADKADVEDKNRKIDEINVRLSATSLAASNGETPAEEEVHLDSSTKAASESQGIAKNGHIDSDMKQSVAESGPLDQDIAQ